MIGKAASASAAFLALLFLLLAPISPALAGEAERLAIKGYDPVAYFTEGKPVKGSPDHQLAWNDARWQFASAAHRDLFRGDPERYAPQYAGYCALGIAMGQKVEIDPQVWTIADGKLYLNYAPQAKVDWDKDRTAYIHKADENWAKLRN